jgi:phi13 family phage major tail protein
LIKLKLISNNKNGGRLNMATQKKRLGGFKNIHVAPIDAVDGLHEIPVPVVGAKEIEAELSYESVQFYADDAIDFSDYLFTGGEGTLTLSGLTNADYQLLFGSKKDTKGNVLVSTTDIAPELAILFERDKLGTGKKVLYCIYACKFAPPTIGAKTKEDGIEEETVELKFTVRSFNNGAVYRILDSSETGVLQADVDGFYTAAPTVPTMP